MIKLSSLSKSYGRGARRQKVLHELSFTLPDTGFVCILGPSGCGKTSLLSAMGGLDRFDSGLVSFGESQTRGGVSRLWEAERNRSFAYIFQNYYLLAEHSAAYNVYLGLHSLELSHSEKLERVREALRAVEMEDYIKRPVGQLSGGQQQRIAIARAIARRPRVIFADEPTGNLDEANTLNICSLLRRISRQSLVVMVTHEEEVAEFFADRIIRLDGGRIVSDRDSFGRPELSLNRDKLIYADDYSRSTVSAEGISLQLLRQDGAAEAQLSVVLLKDRILIKIGDSRSVLSDGFELREGKSPRLDLAELDAQSSSAPLFGSAEQDIPSRRRGLSPAMLLAQARRLVSAGGMKKTGSAVFLLLLSLLVCFTVSDRITLATVDPEDFIVSDSHILELRIDQGKVMYENGGGLSPLHQEYIDYIRQSGQDVVFIPHVSQTLSYSHEIFRQMDAISMEFGAFSYVPAEVLDESALICGRLPQNSDEIVVDRWILERAMEKNGILQNSISDVDYFLDKQFGFMRGSYQPRVVGISDSSQPSVFIPIAGLISIGVNGTAVTPLSELQRLCPGEYDDVELGSRECLVVTNNAGGNYRSAAGQIYLPSREYVIQSAIEAPVSGNIVIPDGSLEDMLWSMSSDRFYLYCSDKAQTAAFLAEKASPAEQAGYIIVSVIDRHGDSMRSYETAAGKRLDGRSLVSGTVTLLCAVMLWLLCRARAHGRIELLSVHRLLGIKRRSTAAIFALESLMLSLITVLPAALGFWFFINVGGLIPALNTGLLMPLSAVPVCFGAITLLHLLLSLLPLVPLLQLPPAVLAAKYDM